MRELLAAARRRLGRIPVVRRIRDDGDLLLKYGTLRPERVPLAYSRHVIFADPREPRGLAILRGYGSGQWALKRIWRDAIERIRPTIVVDVGANYGEFIYFTDYEPGAIVLGIEADPKLMHYLERSRAVHPHCERIELACALASSEPGESVPFYVDTKWSGRSSALRQEVHATMHVEMVPTTSIDAQLSDRVGPSDRLVFKIDVEGYEPRVLAGMERTLATVDKIVGIMEFNTIFLRRLDIDPEEYLTRLRDRFTIRLLEGDNTAVDLTHRPLREIVGDRDIVADIVVASDAGSLSAITP